MHATSATLPLALAACGAALAATAPALADAVAGDLALLPCPPPPLQARAPGYLAAYWLLRCGGAGAWRGGASLVSALALSTDAAGPDADAASYVAELPPCVRSLGDPCGAAGAGAALAAGAGGALRGLCEADAQWRAGVCAAVAAALGCAAALASPPPLPLPAAGDEYMLGCAPCDGGVAALAAAVRGSGAAAAEFATSGVGAAAAAQVCVHAFVCVFVYVRACVCAHAYFWRMHGCVSA